MNFTRTVDLETYFPPTPGRCRFCGRPTQREYCSSVCCHAVTIRTDWPYARHYVAQRAGYYCEACHVDLQTPYQHWLAAKPVGTHSTPEARAMWREDFPDVGVVHHVKPIAKGGGACDEGNLIFLCASCHRAAHLALKHHPGQGRLW